MYRLVNIFQNIEAETLLKHKYSECLSRVVVIVLESGDGCLRMNTIRWLIPGECKCRQMVTQLMLLIQPILTHLVNKQSLEVFIQNSMWTVTEYILLVNLDGDKLLVQDHYMTEEI